MSITEIEISKIQQKIATLIGLKAWGVSLGTGSFITLEFGDALSPDKDTGRQHGEWHLWIYCSTWRLEKENVILAGSEDSRLILDDAIKQLEGVVLRSVNIAAPAFDTVFEFEESMRLCVFPVSFHDDAEHWMLYTPDGSVLTLGPGISWSYKKPSE
jgi:hypothetical protein